MNRLYIIFSFILITISTSATSYESIYLSDGSILEGYTRVQKSDSIIFKTERATICIPKIVIDTEYDCQHDWSELSSQWQESGYFEKDSIGILNDIILKRSFSTSAWSIVSAMEHNPKGVKIIEDGDIVKYLDLNNTEYKLPWSAVVKITRPNKVDKQILSGIIDQITTQNKNGEESTFSGRIVEIIPGKYIKLQTNNGTIKNITYENIVIQSRLGKNPDQSLIAQSEYIDIVVYKIDGNNENIKLSGVISKQDFVTGNVTMCTSDKNSLHNISFSDIIRIEKDVNIQYKPIKETVMSDSDIVINSQHSTFRKFTKLSEGKIKIQSGIGQISKVEITSPEFIIEMRDNLINRGYILFPFELATQKIKHGEYNIFDYTDMSINAINHDSESVSSNNVLKRVYKIDDIKYHPKYFVLYNARENKGVLIEPIYK